MRPGKLRDVLLRHHLREREVAGVCRNNRRVREKRRLFGRGDRRCQLTVVEIACIHKIDVRGDAFRVCIERDRAVALAQRCLGLDELQLRVRHDRHPRAVGKEVARGLQRARRAGIAKEVVRLLCRDETGDA